MTNVNYRSMKITPNQPRVISVVGARPQFVKVAPIHHECARRGISHEVIHSGQHYDEKLSAQFFVDLDIPAPVINLNIGSGTHAGQTGEIMAGLDKTLGTLRPDVVLVYGDTNTTLAAALVVSKRSEYLVHIEAGLRSFNRSMPEEINRVVADHLAHLLLAPTDTSMTLIANEGLSARAHLVGDVMVDALRQTEERVTARPPAMPEGWALNQPYVFATLHRAENTDNPDRLRFLISRLNGIHPDVRLAAHPRLRARLHEFGIAPGGGLTLWEPLSYPQTVAAMRNAVAVVTDSGGLQKEAALLSTPCITARHETEWVETVTAEWNIIDPNLDTTINQWVSKKRSPLSNEVFGDGHAAQRSIDIILSEYQRFHAGV
jgi:UDP-N-acetylglucosamine 2-epimerase (non-hydrolysing)